MSNAAGVVLDRYTAALGRVQMTGIQALARLPIEQQRRDGAAGRRIGTFISGYEGSPLAGYDLELGRMKPLLDANDITFVPGLNEESAATAVQGTQLAPGLEGAQRDGVVGLWYGKAPGLDRATDAVRHGNLMGAHPNGGAVLLVGDDPAAKSSSVPCASDFAFQDLMIPYLYPGDSAEVIDFGLHAIEMSRASGLWTALKIVTAVADGSSTVELGADWTPAAIMGSHSHTPTARLLQPTLGPLERDMVTRRLPLALEYARAHRLNRIVAGGRNDRIGIVAAGRTWLDVRSALARFGYEGSALAESPIRLLKIGMPYPLDPHVVRDFAEGLDQILVVEEKRAFVETFVRDSLYNLKNAPVVVGKTDQRGAELIPPYGELHVDTIAGSIQSQLEAAGVACAAPGTPQPRLTAGRRTLPLVKRAPYFCSGCPHSSSTKQIAGSLTGAGIGCHAMVLLMDEAQVGEVTGLSQMGGEGLQWIGISPFVQRRHYFQNLGDGTFDHSGSLAVRAAVAAGVNVTYKLLYNSAVAMTGGQRAVGGMSVEQIVRVLLAEGVSRIVITTEDRQRYRNVRLPRSVRVLDRSRLEDVQRELASVSGVTVLIHDQECATEKRRRRRRAGQDQPETRVFINERVCEGCGDCGRKSNCLSVQPVQTRFGRKTTIHQGSCNVDASCLDGDCPAFMTVTSAEKPADNAALPALAGLSPLPEPTALTDLDEFGVRLTGIGGTGVVTVSHVLATAGLLTGFTVRSLDQTGLAQKGGAVVSDVRLTRGPGISNRIASGECDLYLGCDLLVAADPANLVVNSATRTAVVLSTSEVPTGAMVSDPTAPFPNIGELVDDIRVRSRAMKACDARDLCRQLLGDDQYANIFLVGVAAQWGVLPVPVAAIEQAIELNNVSVQTNLEALEWGRRFAMDPDVVRDLAWKEKERWPVDATVDGLIRDLATELRHYQDRAYAQRYLNHVNRIRALEDATRPGATELTDAVARHLFKLMAYKDEYEVARLCLQPALRAELTREFGPNARAAWRLHPPVLRALGVRRKLTLGPWFRPVLKALCGMRRLRGTRWDLFGRAHVRQVERELLAEYLEVLEILKGSLNNANLDKAVSIAGLPDMVRGYEDVKLANVALYRAELREQLRAYVDPVVGRTDMPDVSGPAIDAKPGTTKRST